ncbi:ankyrin repeat family protein [Tanacetum coccineum]
MLRRNAQEKRVKLVILDADSKAVMMAWEKPLMEAHAKAICLGGGHILNNGFEMGLVDTAIQQYGPVSHIIVEAHPEVYKQMCASGWAKKENVKLLLSMAGCYSTT